MTMKRLLAVLVVTLLIPASVIAQNPRTVVLLYAFAPEGVLLRQRMTDRQSHTDPSLGQVDVGTLGGVRVALIGTRVGMTHAARATQRAIDLYDPPLIVFSGICGGMSPTNHIGDILLQDEWVQHDFGYVGADGKITVRQGPLDGVNANVSTGPLYTAYFKVDPQLVVIGFAASRDVKLAPVQGRVPEVKVGGIGVSGNIFLDNAQVRQDFVARFSRPDKEVQCVDMETTAIMQTAFFTPSLRTPTGAVKVLPWRSASDLAGGSGSATAAQEIRAFFQVAANNAAEATLASLVWIGRAGMAR